MSEKKQVNVTIPAPWQTQLERLARIYSVEEERTLTYQDLIRQAVQEKYELQDETGIQVSSTL
jgi:hypothetical protein